MPGHVCEGPSQTPKPECSTEIHYENEKYDIVIENRRSRYFFLIGSISDCRSLLAENAVPPWCVGFGIAPHTWQTAVM